MKRKNHGKIFLTLIVIGLLIGVSCKNKDHIWNEESNRTAVEVRQMLNAYFEDINRDGFLAEFKYLDSTDEFSWHPPGFNTPIHFDSVKTILIQNARQVIKVNSRWDSLVVFPESVEKAKYIGDITSALTSMSGQVDTFMMHEEGHVIKRADGWKLLSGTTKLK